MQLVAYGAQDVYLTGNPQITFFKVVYRRYTNFSIECIELPIDSVRPGGRYSVQVLRNGDLATKTYLHVSTTALTAATFGLQYDANPLNNAQVGWVRRLGHAMVRSVEVQIGGSTIDKHWGFWLDIWYELTHTEEQHRGYSKMIGDVPEMTTLVGPSSANDSSTLIAPYHLFVPLQFWFNRNYGLALPLIALQYHEVRLYIDLEDLNKLLVWSGANPPNTSSSISNPYNNGALLVDYVYLDSEERRRFAQVGHEYLIEQLQYPADFALTGTMSGNTTRLPQRLTLNFNHPCKEIIWAHRVGAFNGSSTSRFLAYSATDDSWDAGLLDAAENLVAGMFVPYAGTFGSPSGNEYPIQNNEPQALNSLSNTDLDPSSYPEHLTIKPHANLVAGASANLVSGHHGGLKFYPRHSSSIRTPDGKSGIDFLTVVLVNNTGVDLDLDEEVLGGFDSRNTLTANGSYALTNFLGGSSVTVTVSIDADGSGWVTSVRNVSISNHSLTLRDVSVPVNQGAGSSNPTWVDTRANTNSSTGINSLDYSVIQVNNYGVRLDGAGNMVHYGNLVLNGHDRFNQREGHYFNYVQPWQHHTHTPADGINVYSFGLHPEQHQPSGTCNFSRIDTSVLQYNIVDPLRNSSYVSGNVPVLDLVGNTKVYVLATNYNVLRIMSGMGGLAYSN